ncbi:hypothetical protein [Xanthomonas translucens]|uniref:hypothetical protein n=1 Tax=Xanthomonas campestris pv. translucens TaxID=343 RepID=UPI000B2FE5A0|nr:hypothetical protein [Xanthomonas translucens]
MLRFSKFDIIRKAALPIIAVSAVLSAGSAAAHGVDFDIENHVGKAKALMLSGSGPAAGCYRFGESGIVASHDPLDPGSNYTATAMYDSNCSPGTGMAGLRLNFQPRGSYLSIVIYSSGITTM